MTPAKSNFPPSAQAAIDAILGEVVPTKQEYAHFDEVFLAIEGIVRQSNQARDLPIRFISPQGSTGIKDTALRDASDIDIFIGLDPALLGKLAQAPKSKQRDFIHDLFKDLTTSWLIPALEGHGVENPILSYAEHPYVTAAYQGLDLDIVLCFDITEKYLHSHGPITAVDRTPHHSRYIQEHLTAGQKDQVRALKYIFQCLHCYGDKSAVGRSGFIGYLAELLISYYGDLWTLMQKFGELERKVIFLPPLDPNIANPYRGLSVSQARKKYFYNDYLVVIDPTDVHRNVGASIDPRAFRVVRRAFEEFIHTPSPGYFQKSPLPLIGSLSLPYPLEHFVAAEFHTTEIDHYTKFRDKLYSLMDKFTKLASTEPTLEPRFADVVGELLFDADEGEFSLAFYTSTPHLSEVYRRIGPRVNSGKHEDRFLQKNPDAFQQEGHWCTTKHREYVSFTAFLRNYIGQNPIRDLALKFIQGPNEAGLTALSSRSLANLAINVLPFELD